MEKKTDRLHIKIEPTIKEKAQKLAAEEGRTLSNYIVNLIKQDLKKKHS